MKKKIAFTLMLILVSHPVLAGTAPTTADFLGKLNKYYYSLSRQGLKTFKCDMRIDHFEKAKAEIRNEFYSKPNKVQLLEGMAFQFGLDKDGGWEIYSPQAIDSKDYSFGSKVRNMIDTSFGIAKSFANAWASPAGSPQFSPEELTKYDHQVVNLPGQGFKVVKTQGKKTWTFLFNSQAVLTAFVYSDNGKDRQSIRTTFTQNPGGLLATEFIEDDMEQGQTDFMKVQYQSVSGHLLPSSVSFRRHRYNQRSDTPDLETQLTFTNYEINNSKPGFEIKF